MCNAKGGRQRGVGVRDRAAYAQRVIVACEWVLGAADTAAKEIAKKPANLCPFPRVSQRDETKKKCAPCAVPLLLRAPTSAPAVASKRASFAMRYE